MKHLVLFLVLASCAKEPSKAPSPSPTVPPQQVPKPQPPIFPLPDVPGNGWPSPVPIPPEPIAENEVYLKSHNEKRCWHQVGNLVWNERLAVSSKLHAERCVFAHDASANAGENLALGYRSDTDAIIKGWYSEVSLYNGDWSPQTGHFSQMVWKNTKEIGCAAAECPQGRFLVCRYLPAGNYIGEFSENVLPLRKDLDQCQ